MHIQSLKLFILVFFISIPTIGQEESSKHSHKSSRIINFPDIPGYKTLKTDLHIHSVFSDGYVWPTIRVQEALRDGLDAISLTEHLEYQPHKEDIPHPDRNRSFKLALSEAKNHNLLVINGAEVTRSMPPGHVNAIFITDANVLLKEKAVDAFQEAKKQDAFMFWNHPNWISQKPDGIAVITDMHKQLIKEGKLNGIEVVNEHTFSEEALQIALDHNLTIMGTSDIHGLIDWEFNVPNGGHRPITLVFAKERTIPALQEGLLNRRTVVWFDNSLIGSSEFLVPLIKESLQVKKVAILREGTFIQTVEIENTSDVDFILQNTSDYTLHRNTNVFTVKAHTSITLEVKTLKIKTEFDLKFKVLNAIIAPKKYAEIQFKIKT